MFNKSFQHLSKKFTSTQPKVFECNSIALAHTELKGIRLKLGLKDFPLVVKASLTQSKSFEYSYL